MKIQQVFNMNGLYGSVVAPDRDVKGYIAFAHGGPGNHSAYFEQALQELPAYEELPYGWICYDQRGCGRSERGDQDLTHPQNIDDLKMVLDHSKDELDLNVVSLFGHSYGAWLAYVFCLKNPDVPLKLIMAGLSMDIKHPRNRSLAMDLLLLKIHQPDVYEDVRPILANHQGPMWEVSKDIREKMTHAHERRLFYWGNLAAMEWYDDLKARVPVKESDAVYREVRPSLYSDEAQLRGVDVMRLKQGVFWVNGFLDFLMGGEAVHFGEESPITMYANSGHYPMFEEPERFVRDLTQFLEG